MNYMKLSITVAALGALALGCPRPPAAVLSLVVTSTLAETTPLPKGDGTCAEIDDDDIAGLNITIDEIQLERETDAGVSIQTIFRGPVVVSLMNASETTALIDIVGIPPGTYVNATIFLSNVQMALTTAPTIFLDVDLPNGTLSMPITLMTDGGGQCLLVFELDNAICQFAVGGDYQLNTDLDVEFATELENVEVQGRIDDDPFVQERFELENAEYEVTVDFSTLAGIFLPTDGAAPTGTVADLEQEALVRVTGTLMPNSLIDADIIEILEFDDP